MPNSKVKSLVEQEIKSIIKEIHYDDFQRGRSAGTDHCRDCGGEEHESTGELKAFTFGTGTGNDEPESVDICLDCYEKRRKNQLMNTFSKNETFGKSAFGKPEDEEDMMASPEETPEEPEMEPESPEGDEEESGPEDLQSLDGTEETGGGMKADLMSLSDMLKQTAESVPEEGGEEVEAWVGSHINAAKELLAHVGSYFQEKGGEQGLGQPVAGDQPETPEQPGMEAPPTDMENPDAEGEESEEDREGEDDEEDIKNRLKERLKKILMAKRGQINEMFTKQHYQTLATMLNGQLKKNPQASRTINEIAQSLTSVLKQDNPRFDESFFMNAVKTGNMSRSNANRQAAQRPPQQAPVKEAEKLDPQSEKMRKQSKVIGQMADIQKKYEDETGSAPSLVERKIREYVANAPNKQRAIALLESRIKSPKKR